LKEGEKRVPRSEVLIGCCCWEVRHEGGGGGRAGD